MANPVQSQNPRSRKPGPLPSVERVRELFNYDPITGNLTIRVMRKRLQVGALVGTVNNWGRLICRIDYKIYYVHRIIWLHYHGAAPPELIDHINGNVLDNRICNLRAASYSENCWNQNGSRIARSGIKGAHWSSSEKKWRSSIRRNGKIIHLGWFKTMEEAAAAYEAASKDIHGEFSVFRRASLSAIMLIVAIIYSLLPSNSYAHDPNRPELNAWFDSLKSGKGPCCSTSDGTALSDVDWETRNGHYRVRLEGQWIDVPDDAVITEPNRAGRTMVWPIRGYMGTDIRCFMPGSMT